jgi:isoleucyl-tRNA synthetase
VMLPLWNTHSFFTTYAGADDLTLGELAAAPPPGERPEIDRWILSVLQSLIATVNTQMEGYHLYNVISPTLGFIDDLTNWYVRRSRRRFWAARGEDDRDKLSAFATLYEVLTTFIRVLAPVLPFITERLYQDLVIGPGGDGPDSIHLASFPIADPARIDTDLEGRISVVRRVVSAGHALRKRRGIRVRQPLARVTVITSDPRVAAAVEGHANLIAEELNVREVVASSHDGGLVDLSAKADFSRLGPRLGGDVKTVAAAIEALSGEEVGRLVGGETLEVEGHPITAQDLVVTRSPREGTVVETDRELAVALDTRLDNRLVAEGLARDVVSRIQQARRGAGLDVADRIRLRWSTGDARLASAVEDHRDYIAAETLAEEMEQADGLEGARSEVDGSELVVVVEKV